MSRYELRILMWSWGLMVDLGLTARAVSTPPSEGIFITHGAWLVVQPPTKLWDGDMPPLMRGLRRVTPKFRSVLADEGEVVFVLDHLWYPFTDSQDDAVELAVVGWAAEFLKIHDEPASVSFDRVTNRYLIDFDEEIWAPA